MNRRGLVEPAGKRDPLCRVSGRLALIVRSSSSIILVNRASRGPVILTSSTYIIQSLVHPCLRRCNFDIIRVTTDRNDFLTFSGKVAFEGNLVCRKLSEGSIAREGVGVLNINYVDRVVC